MVKDRVSERIDKGYAEVISLQYDTRTKGQKGRKSGDEFFPADCSAAYMAIIENQREITRVSIAQREDGYDYTSNAAFGRWTSGSE